MYTLYLFFQIIFFGDYSILVYIELPTFFLNGCIIFGYMDVLSSI